MLKNLLNEIMELFSDFPSNNAQYDEVYGNLWKDFVGISFYGYIPKSDGVIDWVKYFQVQNNFSSAFQELVTYQTVRNYIENTINPQLTRNLANFTKVFTPPYASEVLELNELIKERVFLMRVSLMMLGWCDSEGARNFPSYNFSFSTSPNVKPSPWKQERKAINMFGQQKTFTERYIFNDDWGKEL